MDTVSSPHVSDRMQASSSSFTVISKSPRQTNTTLSDGKKGNTWDLVEEYIFFEAHKILGNKWSSITRLLLHK
jgi:hypothetical protein